VGSAVHLIEPLDGGSEEGKHAVYQAKHLKQKAGTCGVSNTSLDNLLGTRVLAAFRPQPRVSSFTPCLVSPSQAPSSGLDITVCSPELTPYKVWRQHFSTLNCLDSDSQH
jgi:hypothetical protein